MKTAATGIVLALAVLAAGCGGGSKSAAPPAASTQAPPPAKTPGTTTAATGGAPEQCRTASEAIVRRIETHVVLEGSKLTHAQVVPALVYPGLYFVSARIDGGGTTNKVATWAVDRLGSRGPVYAVDTWAALISTYVAAGQKNPDLSVHVASAYKSRVCVGGPHVPRGDDAPLSGRPTSGR